MSETLTNRNSRKTAMTLSKGCNNRIGHDHLAPKKSPPPQSERIPERMVSLVSPDPTDLKTEKKAGGARVYVIFHRASPRGDKRLFIRGPRAAFSR